MEPFYEEDELERQIRRSRRLEQMLREKRKQERHRRFIKKYWPFLVGGLGVILIVLVAITTGNRQDTEDGKLLAGIEGGLEQGDVAENITDGTSAQEPSLGAVALPQVPTAEPVPTEPIVTDTPTMDPAPTEPMATATPTTEPNNHQNNGNTGNGTNDVTGSPYRFETTSDTATIYSEEVISTNAILINESTDTIIASKGAGERISPASMTKVLTVLVAAEHISAEDLEEPFQITLEYTDYAYINDCSTAGFARDEVVKVKDLFYGTILPSGGEAAVALATYVAGSHEAFVELMNEKLEELGLAESAHFTNCVGLYDKEHYCTVYDMAVIMKAALQNEWCREVLSAHSYTTTATTQHPDGIVISNWFLRRIEDKDTGGEVLSAKTGYVNESGSCAVSYGVFADETPYICVTKGSSSTWRCIYDHVEIYNRYVLKE